MNGLFDPIALNDDSAYADVPTAAHATGTNGGNGGSPTFYAWLIVLAALGGLWLLGGIVFRSINVH